MNLLTAAHRHVPGACARLRELAGPAALIAVGLLMATPARAQDPPPPQPAVEYRLDAIEGMPADVMIGGEAFATFWVYPNGLIAFGDPVERELRDSPLGLSALAEQIEGERPGAVVAPLWNPMGGVCEGAPVNDGRNEISVTGEGGAITVRWSHMTRRAEACDPEPATSTFSARLSWPEVTDDDQHIFRVEFDYGVGGDLAPAGEPRAGVIAPRMVMELLPDEGKRRTGRAASLVRGGSGDLRPGADVDDPAAGKGYWVIEVDANGALFGDEGDGIRVGDNCPAVLNVRQHDLDRDGFGDLCDQDVDGDVWTDRLDNCPRVANPSQADADADGLGDLCDADRDGDTIPNRDDNCLDIPNAGQFDLDWDGLGDLCDPDPDGDRVVSGQGWGVNSDTCPWIFDPRQMDKDGDGLGDPCDWMPSDAGRNFGAQGDADGDRVPDLVDLCPFIRDPWQADRDRDGIGDACDPDVGNDGKADVLQGRCHSTPSGIVGDCVLDVEFEWRAWDATDVWEGG